jgi:hypothetical protein
VLETLGMTVCGRPLRELSATAVADAASGAMDALKSDTGGLENDDRETDENEDTVESLRARVAALEEELLLSKRAARLMRARK